MQILLTWAGKSEFGYEGSVETGTTINYGKGGRYTMRVEAEDYAALLDHFRGKTVKAGTVRGGPGSDSLGDWLTQHVSRTALASYVAAILLHEGHAERVAGDPTCLHVRTGNAK